MPERYDKTSDHPFVWNGILAPSQTYDHVVSKGHRLADAAKTGDWSRVFRLLDGPGQPMDVNWWRPGGTAWFTPLHQAAWHGAPVDVIAELLRRGALRSLTDSRGRTAYDVRVDSERNLKISKHVAAQQQKSLALRSLLKPPPSPLVPDRNRALDTHLADVIDSRIRGVLHDGRKAGPDLRYPPVGILHEVPGQHLWFPVADICGGFNITQRHDYLEVKSWCRGSGQAHLITHAGAILVDEGFV